MVDMPNKVVFDNFSATTMQQQDEWVNAPLDPFVFLRVGEVLYSENFSNPTGSWSQSTDPGQTVKLENGKLALTNTTDDSWVYSKLESLTWFNSGVMMETDVTIAPKYLNYFTLVFYVTLMEIGTTFMHSTSWEQATLLTCNTKTVSGLGLEVQIFQLISLIISYPDEPIT